MDVPIVGVDRDPRRIGERGHPAQDRGLPPPAVLQGGAVRPRATTSLFEIDPRQFRAALEQARGALARAEAQLAKATKDVERFTPLAAQRAISQQELDNALAAQRDARGGLVRARGGRRSGRAQPRAGRRSPHLIEGIVGIAKTQVGDLVNTQTVMTTVSTVDPIRVTIGISEREYMDRAVEHQPGELRDDGARADLS